MNVKGAVAVVTGAGGGIGAALARKLHAEGAEHVVVCDIDGDAAAAVSEEIGGTAERLDVGNGAAVIAMIGRTQSRLGRIDLYCSNAGITSASGLEAENSVWQQAFDVNVMAHVHAARTVIPGMLERGTGYVVLTASAAGILSQPGDAPYTVTKHATVGLAEWIAITYGGRGVGFSVLCPMGVTTPMFTNPKPGGDEAAGVVAASGNVVTPEQVADAVLDGIHSERFLILPQPEAGTFLQRKATDPDRWLAGMRRLVARSAG
jgi:NAD(P)-dependent dehydrogenase (short-subunit alcohol dehydrogenase family)